MFDISEETELRNLPDSVKCTLGKLLDKEGIYHYHGTTGTQEEWKTLMAHIPEFMPVTSDNLIHGKRKYKIEHIQMIEEESRRRGVPPFKLLLGEWGTSGRKRPKVGDLALLMRALDMHRAASYITRELLKYDNPPETEDELEKVMLNLEGFEPQFTDLSISEATKYILEEDEIDIESNYTNVPLELSPALIKEITDNFNERSFKDGGRKMDGRGLFGSVFVGVVPSNTDDNMMHKLRIKSLKYQPFRYEDNTTRVAVKRLKAGTDNEYTKKMFNAEVNALKRLEHINIIPLLGYSFDGQLGNIVYPLMINGSLDYRLLSEDDNSPLPWCVRVDIVHDVAKGLEYIHSQKSLDGAVLVHRDIKSANILLDQDLNAKISDFGLLRCGSNQEMNKTLVMTQMPVGTNCYMPLEAFRGVVEPSWDIYSFGVVILEVLTGLPPIDQNNRLLSSYSDDGCLITGMLDSTAGSWPENIVETLFALSRRCLGEKRSRPIAATIVQEIEKLITRVPIELDYEFLKKTTNDFDDMHVNQGGRKLGEGGFGIVYVGTLAYQEGESMNVTLLRRNAARVQGLLSSQLNRIAVKRLCKKKALDHGPELEKLISKLFVSEIENMSRFSHPNLLTLLGFCAPEVDITGVNSIMFEERCLVYPLMVNGSLEDRLVCKDQSQPLSWETRTHILKQVISAIKYLHTFEKKAFIHRDIKSANVLLDEHCLAKIGDFGLVRAGKSGVTTGIPGETDNPMGTPIYMSIEAVRGDISAKMDVFSFGVVILEVLSGIIASGDNKVGAIVISPDGASMIDVDPKAGDWPEELCSSLFQLATICFGSKQERPTSTQVYSELSNIVDFWLEGVAV
ncbi:tyrosine-protein kinase JAK2-like isoform X2 [Artemia franciscana]|uniref:tyrosine-protein kinase JAK2-like isoform X2 n=1 Tax=Artemia franciscana TaxID=6661 RepID=UPI0032DBD7D6